MLDFVATQLGKNATIISRQKTLGEKRSFVGKGEGSPSSSQSVPIEQLVVELHDPRQIKRFTSAFGYKGHNFDFFLTWLEYGNSFGQRLISLNTIVVKQLAQIADEIQNFEHF